MKCVRVGLASGLFLLCSCSAIFGERGPRADPAEGGRLVAEPQTQEPRQDPVRGPERDPGSEPSRDPQATPEDAPPAVADAEPVAPAPVASKPVVSAYPFLPHWVVPTDKDLRRSDGLRDALRFLETGEAERASVQLQQVRAVGTFGSEVTALHAWSLAEAGELDAASAIAREGVAVYGATPALGYVMAVLYELEDRPHDALPLYRDLSTLAPDDLKMLEACARTAVASRRGQEALAYLDRWMLAEPLGIEGKRLRASALHLSGRPDDALALYRQMLGAWPEDPVLLAEIAEATYATADSTRQVDHLEQAVELLESLAELDPQRSSAFRRLGHAQSLLGRVPEAMAAYRRCLELEPGDVEAGLNLAALHVNMGDPEASAEVLLDLLRQPLAAADVESVQSALLELR